MTAFPERDSAIDALRVILAIFVIGIHTGFPDLAQLEARQMLVNGLYRVAVPVFALISGFFFAGAVQRRRGGRYLRRIVGLYAIWMLVYAPFYGPEITSPGHLLQLWVFGYFHLWFLAGMILAGVLLLALIRWQVPLRRIVMLALFLAGVGIGLQYLVLSERVLLPLDLYRNGILVIFPFFAMGYALALSGLRRIGAGGAVLTALSLLAVMAESLIWYCIAGGTYGVDTMLSLLIFAPLIVLAALSVRGIPGGRGLASLAAFTYFAHILAMIAATRLGLEGDPKFAFVVALCLGLWCLLHSFGAGRRLLAILT